MSVNYPLKYSGRTSHFQLPVFRPDSAGNDIGAGTFNAPRPSARAEQRAANIIDMQLFGSKRSLLGKTFDSCVLSEGNYSISGQMVTLDSVEAFIDGIFVNNQGDPLTWAVPIGVEVDLYIALIETGPNVKSSAFRSSREYGQLNTVYFNSPSTPPDNHYLILARVIA